MSMVDGRITQDGASAGHTHSAAETPTIGGMKITGVYGTGAPKKSGSIYAVRTPIFDLTTRVAMKIHLDWASAKYRLDSDPHDYVVQMHLHDVADDRERLTKIYNGVRHGGSLPSGTSEGGGSALQVFTVPGGSWYISASFFGTGVNKKTWNIGSTTLFVAPMKAAEVEVSFQAKYDPTTEITTVMDESVGADYASIVWGDSDAYHTVPSGGAAAYAYADQVGAEAQVIVSDPYGAIGENRSVSSDLIWLDVPSGLDWASVNPATRWIDVHSDTDL